MDLGGFMETGWGHIKDTILSRSSKSKELKKYIKKNTSGELLNIVLHLSDNMSNAVKITLVGGKTFCMGQIPTQCGWIVVGDYDGGKDSDFLTVVEVAEILSKLCNYGGFFINSYTKEENSILEDYGFTCIYTNDVISLFHKTTGIVIDKYYEDDGVDEEWEDY